jgi:hypothetical protein
MVRVPVELIVYTATVYVAAVAYFESVNAPAEVTACKVDAPSLVKEISPVVEVKVPVAVNAPMVVIVMVVAEAPLVFSDVG